MKSVALSICLLFSSLLLITIPSHRAEAAEESIKVPALKEFKTLKGIYKSDGTPQILMVIHFPKGPGKTFIEAYNLTKRNISIFQFSIHSVGQTGDLSYEDLLAGWSSVKESNMSNIREFTIIQPRAIDDKATEFYPKLVVHYEIGLQKQMSTGAKKQIGK
ncbi:MAG: hypothetical protein EOP07_21365 [Proteobacteria bacterium]|nr:MAG: hypothetical protein EOP07_21365 [Pseudomonadota bacterium]